MKQQRSKPKIRGTSWIPNGISTKSVCSYFLSKTSTAWWSHIYLVSLTSAISFTYTFTNQSLFSVLFFGVFCRLTFSFAVLSSKASVSVWLQRSLPLSLDWTRLLIQDGNKNYFGAMGLWRCWSFQKTTTNSRRNNNRTSRQLLARNKEGRNKQTQQAELSHIIYPRFSTPGAATNYESRLIQAGQCWYPGRLGYTHWQWPHGSTTAGAKIN